MRRTDSVTLYSTVQVGLGGSRQGMASWGDVQNVLKVRQGDRSHTSRCTWLGGRRGPTTVPTR